MEFNGILSRSGLLALHNEHTFLYHYKRNSYLLDSSMDGHLLNKHDIFLILDTFHTAGKPETAAAGEQAEVAAGAGAAEWV